MCTLVLFLACAARRGHRYSTAESAIAAGAITDLEDASCMDRTQADAIAEALMLPEPLAQLQRERTRAAQARSLAQRRWVAGISLPCMAIGALVAHFNGQHFAHGIVVGGLIGGALGRALCWCRERRTG
jgi:hypothetical protein